MTETISYEDFAKLDLRTARILQAEPIEGADKLLKLTIDLGEERQIVAGMAKHYTPEELVGKTIIVIANLEPAVIRGVKSEGMLLAVSDGDNVNLLTVDRETSAGCQIS
jgi:methionyl-tRNA synthetase